MCILSISVHLCILVNTSCIFVMSIKFLICLNGNFFRAVAVLVLLYGGIT